MRRKRFLRGEKWIQLKAATATDDATVHCTARIRLLKYCIDGAICCCCCCYSCCCCCCCFCLALFTNLQRCRCCRCNTLVNKQNASAIRSAVCREQIAISSWFDIERCARSYTPYEWPHSCALCCKRRQKNSSARMWDAVQSNSNDDKIH